MTKKSTANYIQQVNKSVSVISRNIAVAKVLLQKMGGIQGGGACPLFLHFNFRTKRAKRGPKISVSNRDITFYRRSEIIRTINYTIFTAYATIFVQFIAAFNFSNYIRERLLHVKVQYLPLDLLKSFFLWIVRKKTTANKSFKIFFENKRNIHYKWSTIKCNSINTGTSENILWGNSSILMWPTSKDWETGYFIRTGPTEKFL